MDLFSKARTRLMNSHALDNPSQSKLHALPTLLHKEINVEPADGWQTSTEDAAVIEIRDPEIDVQAIMAQIRQQKASRGPLPPSAASLGRVRMAQQRKKIVASLKELKARIRDYGVIDSHKKGWLGLVDLFIKRSVRKLVQRHILQQHRVHLKLHTVLDQLIQYLQDEDVSIRLCIDQSERQSQKE
jgi:hypothetical protein